MSRKVRWLIVLDDGSWAIVRLQGTSAETVAQQPFEPQNLTDVINAIPAALAEHRYRNQPVLLALGGMHCAAATVSIPTPRHARNHEAMTYLLEPSLPWSAENVVMDFERSGTQAFMVAVERAPLEEIVQSWRDAGIRLHSIVPLARLLLEGELSALPSRADHSLFLQGSDTSVEAWMMSRQQPIGWQHFSVSVPEVVRSVQLMILTEPTPLTMYCRGLSDELLSELQRFEELNLQRLPEPSARDPFLAASVPAGQILDGRCHAPLEFCRESLAITDRTGSTRKSVALLQLSVILLLLSVGAALLLKARQADEHRQAIIEQQKQIFQRVFPDRRVPEGVRLRLQSERLRLQGLRGGGEEAPESIAALAVLQRLLQSLPKELRYRLLEVRIEDGQLAIIGEVRDHSDADKIAAALRQSGLRVASPQTHRLPEQGVGFRISAEWRVESTGEAPA